LGQFSAVNASSTAPVGPTRLKL